MKSWKTFAAATCLGVLSMTGAMADQWNKKTYLTVNEPIQVPGKVLQPGRYVMRLLDSPANRHIVQIYNDREDQLQTTVLAIPNYRMQPTGKTEFQWWETPAGQPKAMRAWFYPGDNFGQEFAYPKSEAVAIATATNSTVPTTAAKTETELTTARVSTVDKSGTEKELDRQTYQAPANTEVAANQTTPRTTTPADNGNQTTQVAQNTQMAQNTMPAATPDTTRSRTLPRTGSEMPLFGLAGFLALGAGAAVRALGSRR
jgi:LPXTG-motif cell wall-anchored protein